VVRAAPTNTREPHATECRAADLGICGGGSALSLYVDSSGLVKLFVAEQGTEVVQDIVQQAPFAACSRLGFVECTAAIARARRERRMTRQQEGRALAELRSFWIAIVMLELDDAVMERAAEICRLAPVRAADAVHLASAEVVSERPVEETQFVCFDRRLWQAAAGLGFDVRPVVLA